MICRSCGTEIADKAIVCYRCGAPTAEPRRRPLALGGRGRLAMRLSLLGAAAVIVAVAVLVLPRLSEGWPRAMGWVSVVVVTFVVSRTIRGRFRR